MLIISLQAAVPLLAPHQDRLESLALNMIGQISHTAINQAGSFFLQKLIGILATHYPASPALLLIKDEIIQDLDQVSCPTRGGEVVRCSFSAGEERAWQQGGPADHHQL